MVAVAMYNGCRVRSHKDWRRLYLLRAWVHGYLQPEIVGFGGGDFAHSLTSVQP